MSNINNRNTIKWQPFDSLINTARLKNDISWKKQKCKLPTLSEDQIIDIEDKIKSAYYTKEKIKIYYFKDGFIYNKSCVINYIDTYRKQIVLDDNSIIHIEQIIRIDFF